MCMLLRKTIETMKETVDFWLIERAVRRAAEERCGVSQ